MYSIGTSMNTNKPSFQSLPGDFLPRLGAGVLLLIGLLIFSMELIHFIIRSGGIFALMFNGLVGVGFAVCGIFWLRYISALEQTRRRLYVEKEVLSAAARHGGYATIAQIALDSPITIGEAQGAIEELCRHGVAHPELTDDGTVVYRFQGLLPPKKFPRE